VLVELLLQFGLFGDERVDVRIGYGEFGVDFIEAPQHFDDGTHRFFDDADDCSRFVELWFLLEHANAVTLAHGDLADVFLIHARHDAKQCGFARAVEAEHADLGAVVEAERDVAQDLFIGRDNLPNTVHGVDDKGIGGHMMILRERVIVNGYSWLVSRD